MLNAEGYNKKIILTCHWGNDTILAPNPNWNDTGIDLYNDFHIYEMEWNTDTIIFRFDGRTIKTVSIKSRAEDVLMDNAFRQQNHDIRFMIQMHETGMVSPSQVVNDTTTLPQSMVVDGVRVYQK